jgi:hypothetical protein
MATQLFVENIIRLREKDRLKSRSLSGALPTPSTSIAAHSPFPTIQGSTAIIFVFQFSGIVF